MVKIRKNTYFIVLCTTVLVVGWRGLYLKRQTELAQSSTRRKSVRDSLLCTLSRSMTLHPYAEEAALEKLLE